MDAMTIFLSLIAPLLALILVIILGSLKKGAGVSALPSRGSRGSVEENESKNTGKISFTERAARVAKKSRPHRLRDVGGI